MSEASPRSATILRFRKKAVPERAPVRMARTIELYATLYPTPHKMVLLVEGWLFAAQRDGMSMRNPEYVAALRRAITALRFSNTVAQAIALLRSQEAGFARNT
jgi:hypothetical protein